MENVQNVGTKSAFTPKICIILLKKLTPVFLIIDHFLKMLKGTPLSTKVELVILFS